MISLHPSHLLLLLPGPSLSLFKAIGNRAQYNNYERPRARIYVPRLHSQPFLCVRLSSGGPWRLARPPEPRGFLVEIFLCKGLKAGLPIIQQYEKKINSFGIKILLSCSNICFEQHHNLMKVTLGAHTCVSHREGNVLESRMNARSPPELSDP